MNKFLYIVEGEIEDRFLNQVKEDDYIIAGRVRKFNLMQKKLSAKNSILNTKYDEIFCIIDTDRVDTPNLQVLRDNLKQLQKIGKIVLLIQHQNFEDELLYMVNSRNIKTLCTMFNLSHGTVKDLKEFLNQKIRYQKYISKEMMRRYCARPEVFKRHLEETRSTINTKIIFTGQKIIK